MKNCNNNNSLINKRLKDGDIRAYQTIFNRYYARVFAYINSYTKNEYAAKDIVQETFIKLWINRETIDIESSIQAYLHRIAYNIFIDNYRKDKRRQHLLTTLSYEAIYVLGTEESDLTSQKIDFIKKSVEELPSRCKEIFKLCKYEGLRYSEIAQILNISVKTVETQMGKAYAYIRDKTKKHFNL